MAFVLPGGVNEPAVTAAAVTMVVPGSDCAARRSHDAAGVCGRAALRARMPGSAAHRTAAARNSAMAYRRSFWSWCGHLQSQIRRAPSSTRDRALPIGIRDSSYPPNKNSSLAVAERSKTGHLLGHRIRSAARVYGDSGSVERGPLRGQVIIARCAGDELDCGVVHARAVSARKKSSACDGSAGRWQNRSGSTRLSGPTEDAKQTPRHCRNRVLRPGPSVEPGTESGPGGRSSPWPGSSEIPVPRNRDAAGNAPWCEGAAGAHGHARCHGDERRHARHDPAPVGRTAPGDAAHPFVRRRWPDAARPGEREGPRDSLGARRWAGPSSIGWSA